MYPYLGIGTVVKNHVGEIGRIIGYDDENKIVTIQYRDKGVTSVRRVSEIAQDIKAISYKEVK